MPLVPLSATYHQYLRPHLASFYSDWFLRYTSITRASATKTREDTEEEEAEVEEAQSSNNTDSKENQGRMECQF